ncbi:MAG TPA: hypothetical protein VMY99_01330 [Nevskiaceae bacterium]|nr:hypothetical protein [Nevskiaceae bacterium]
MEVATSDPSNLLSTLSQSSAAMVAIIGGFLVSKLVAISSEREGLRRQLVSAKQKLKHIKPAYESAHNYRLDNSKSAFFDWVLDDLVQAGLDEVDYEALINSNTPRGSSLEEMLPEVVSLHERIKQAYGKISPRLKGAYSDSDLDLEDLKNQGLAVAEAEEPVYESVFYLLKSQLPETPPVSVMGMVLPKLPSFSVGPITPAWNHEVDARRLDESIREEQSLKEQLVAIESEIERLTFDLAKLGRPVGIIPAVWILALLSLVGIVLPVIVMAFDPPALSDVIKVILISSFIWGLTAVLGYIVWYLKKINN